MLRLCTRTFSAFSFHILIGNRKYYQHRHFEWFTHPQRECNHRFSKKKGEILRPTKICSESDTQHIFPTFSCIPLKGHRCDCPKKKKSQTSFSLRWPAKFSVRVRTSHIFSLPLSVRYLLDTHDAASFIILLGIRSLIWETMENVGKSAKFLFSLRPARNWLESRTQHIFSTFCPIPVEYTNDYHRRHSL